MGKTALALQAARAVAGQYPDGTFYLNLHTHDPGHPSLDATEALHRLLRMLTAPATQIPDAPGERAALLRAQLGRRRAIVILDDADAGDQIRPLLPEAGQCLILITTRRKLPGLEGARALTLDALPIDDAITLFQRVAGHAAAHDAGEAAMAVELCGRLPLAIQLAAGRLAAGLPAPARRPGRGAVALAGARREPSLGQPGGDVGLRSRLPLAGTRPTSGSSGGWGSAPALTSACRRRPRSAGAPCADAEEALAALLDHHLLARAPAGQFRFHDLIRDYAALRAAHEDSRAEQRQAVGRLLDYYLRTADEADQVLHPFRRRTPVPRPRPAAASSALSTQQDAAGWLESEWHNILQAAQYAGQHEWKKKCADLTHALAGFMEIRAYWDEAIAAHTLALQAGRDLADPARTARAALELSRGEPADGPLRGGPATGRGRRRDLPVAGRPAGRGRRPRSDRHGPPAGGTFP